MYPLRTCHSCCVKTLKYSNCKPRDRKISRDTPDPYNLMTLKKKQRCKNHLRNVHMRNRKRKQDLFSLQLIILACRARGVPVVRKISKSPSWKEPNEEAFMLLCLERHKRVHRCKCMIQLRRRMEGRGGESWLMPSTKFNEREGGGEGSVIKKLPSRLRNMILRPIVSEILSLYSSSNFLR